MENIKYYKGEINPIQCFRKQILGEATFGWGVLKLTQNEDIKNENLTRMEDRLLSFNHTGMGKRRRRR